MISYHVRSKDDLMDAVVLPALLFAVTRRQVRAHFGGQPGIRATTA
jgi:hypothetical protein